MNRFEVLGSLPFWLTRSNNSTLSYSTQLITFLLPTAMEIL